MQGSERWNVAVDQLAIDSQFPAQKVDAADSQTAGPALAQTGTHAEGDSDGHPVGETGPDPLHDLERDRLGFGRLTLRQAGPACRVAGDEAIIDGQPEELAEVLGDSGHGARSER